MGNWTRLKAEDGHELNAYVACPPHAPLGALVIVQEIFGVNAHIRSVADGYAREGYLAVVPALFDRVEPGVELQYVGEDQKRAFELMHKLNPETALKDVAAAFHLATESGKGVGVIGFCFGGLMAWLSATRGATVKMQPACCVGYYAGGIGKVAQEEPTCPVMLNFGAEDTHIGKDQIEAVEKAHPEVEVYVYPGAGHAFNRDVDPNAYHAPSASQARDRVLAFLRTHIG